MSVDAKFIRDIDQYFKYPSDENPTTQQAYQEAVRNWVGTEEAIVDSHLWQPTTNYSEGNQVKTPSLPPQCVLVCTAAGTSGNEEPDYTNVDVGDSVTDGTVTWLVSEAIVGGDFVKTHAYGISTDKTALNFYINTSNPEDVAESMQLNSGGLNIGGKALNNASNVFLNGTGNIYGYKNGSAFSLFCGNDDTDPTITMWGKNHSTNSGWFRLRSSNGSVSASLVGKPDGTLTWGGLWEHSQIFVQAPNNTTFLRMCGGQGADNGAMISLWGKSHSTNAGEFRLQANNGTNSVGLIGYPNGTLTWGGNNVLTDGDTGTVVSGSISSDVSLSASTAKNIKSISLTKGTWIVTGSIRYANATSGNTYGVAVSSTSADFDYTHGGQYLKNYNGGTMALSACKTITLSANGNVYLVGYSNTSATADVGNISAVKICN